MLELTFINAILKIGNIPEYTICEDITEHTGLDHDVCVYKNGEFVGKLRWPKDGKPARIDELLKELLSNE